MRKLFTVAVLLLMLLNAKGQEISSAIRTTIFQKPSEYKTSWQRLLLQLSQAFYTVAKENQVDLDSSLIYCAHSLGLSRLPVIAEGINASDLSGQLKWIDQRQPKDGLRMLSASAGKKHLELLVLLGAYYAFEPDSYHRYKDSVLYFSNKAIDESKVQHEQRLGWQARLLIGKMYVDGYDFQHGDPIFDQLTKDCQAAKDSLTQAKILFYRGLYTGFVPVTTPKRIAYLHQAQKLYHQQNNTEGEISALTDICYLNVPIYKMAKAGEAAFEALSRARSINFPFIQYNTDAVAMITIFEGKFGEPLKYALETVRVAEAVHDSIGLGSFYGRVGQLYFSEDAKHKEAGIWLEKAVNAVMKTGNDKTLYQDLLSLVSYLTISNRPNEALDILQKVSKKTPPESLVDKLFYDINYATYYKSVKNYDAAEKYLASAISIERQLEKNGYSFRNAVVTGQLGVLYFLKREYSKARLFDERYLSDPLREGGGLRSDLDILGDLIKMDSIQGNNALAVRHYSLYKKRVDSDYAISKKRQAEELQFRYSTKEKENQAALVHQKTKLEQINSNKARLLKNVTIGGIVLVVIIAMLLYRQSRLRQANNKIVMRQNKLITQKNELLQKLDAEKEWLLNEVNHRVKNNLHTVVSLLESQAMFLENDALKAMETSKHRIFSMSLIHQKLYQSDGVKTIDMSLYLPELVAYLRDSFNAGKHIHFNLAVDPVQLSVSQAIPLALTLNEAITNSIKYAFPDNRRGEISIKMRQKDGNVQLIIRDNGVGMVKTTENINIDSFGLILMRGLIEEIDGHIQFQSNHGTIIRITFKIDFLVGGLPFLN